MMLIVVVAVTMAVVKVRTSYCWQKAGSHARQEEYHLSEAARAKALWAEHKKLAAQRAAQFKGSDDYERLVAFDPQAKAHRIEALFQRYTMGYNMQMAQWYAGEKKRYEQAARRPWVPLPQDSSPLPMSRPRREQEVAPIVRN